MKLANRIESLRQQESTDTDPSESEDLPENARQAAGEAVAALNTDKGLDSPTYTSKGKKKLSDLAKSAIFKEVVLAKVRQVKEQAEREKLEKTTLG